MYKRKISRSLLAMLVIAGFAGTTSGSLTKGERKYAASFMKETKGETFKSLKGLNEAQLNFTATPESWSVKECIYHIAISETTLWQWFESIMKAPANPEKRSEIKLTDEQVIKILKDRSRKVKTKEAFEPKNASYQSIDEALAAFKASRESNIKYIKTTTQDLRNHVAETPIGWVDAYQMYLFICAHTDRHVQQINEVKANASFPK